MLKVTTWISGQPRIIEGKKRKSGIKKTSARGANNLEHVQKYSRVMSAKTRSIRHVSRVTCPKITKIWDGDISFVRLMHLISRSDLESKENARRYFILTQSNRNTIEFIAVLFLSFEFLINICTQYKIEWKNEFLCLPGMVYNLVCIANNLWLK